METKGNESAAIQLLNRAVQLDGEKKFSEAVTCYEQGIRLLLQAMKECVSEDKKKHFRKKVDEYLNRAEILKKAAVREKDLQKSHRQVHVADGETGHSYEREFGFLIDDTLTAVEIEDAYIRQAHQIYNFLRFCELLVKRAQKLKKITLHTTYCNENRSLQQERLGEIDRSLSSHGVTLELVFSDTLHDREIRFDTGVIIKIGRGLDIYKRANGRFSVGSLDFDLRPCHETTIDIFHQNTVKKYSSSS